MISTDDSIVHQCYIVSITTISCDFYCKPPWWDYLIRIQADKTQRAVAIIQSTALINRHQEMGFMKDNPHYAWPHVTKHCYRWLYCPFTLPHGDNFLNLEFGIEGHFRRENLTSFLAEWKTLLTIARPGREPTTSHTPRLHNKQGVPHTTCSAIGSRYGHVHYQPISGGHS